jgi:hypothetical protein
MPPRVDIPPAQLGVALVIANTLMLKVGFSDAIGPPAEGRYISLDNLKDLGPRDRQPNDAAPRVPNRSDDRQRPRAEWPPEVTCRRSNQIALALPCLCERAS